MAIMVMRSSGGKRPVDEVDQGVGRWIVVGIDSAGEAVAQRGHAGGLHAGMNVVGGELADGLLLLDIREANFLASDRLIELVVRDLLASRSHEESFL